MSRFLSPLTLLAGLWIGVGLSPAVAQDDPTPPKDPKTTVGPKPRVVGEEKKTPKVEAPAKDPGKLTFDPVPEKKPEPAKPDPKPEAPPAPPPAPPEAKADPKTVEPKADEPKKDEAKKEDPKPDPVAVADKKASDADAKATVATQRGDNAWILVSSALVLLMTPGLALFYGGMVRRKNVLATMMQSYAAMAIVGLYWVAVGYGLAFGPSQIIAPDFLADLVGGEAARGGGMIGWDSKLFFLKGIDPQMMLPGYNIPVYTHVMFQGMFAIITPALISGAVAERIRFWPWVIFMTLWITVVYCPLAHMVWAFDWFAMDPATPGKDVGATAIGLLGKAGALDFAGGTVVHIAAGFGGLACMLSMKKRTGYPEHAMHPNSMVLTLIGAGLLWFGWFGFNGGSALGAGDLAGTGFTTTQCAAAAAGLTWCLVEWIFKGKPTALGLASGIVAGLVAVTPASGFVLPYGGVAIGVAAGVVCYFSVQVKAMLGYDDSLDAFGVHGVGGFLGAVLTGVFSYAVVQSASADGFFAHRGLPGQITALKEEAEKLKKEIPPIKATEEGLKKASDDAAAKAEAEKDPKKKKDLDAKAAAAKAESEEVAKKVKRREDRISDIEKSKDEKVPDDKGGLIVQTQDKIDGYKDDDKGPMTQPLIQLKAALFSAVFAFVLSLALAFAVQAMTLGNFRTSVADENEGLDQTEHGETGFDFGGIDTFPTTTPGAEPKAAKVPPGGKRFQVVVEGIENGELMRAWSQLCLPSAAPPDPDFTAVYRYVTTVQGNRFRLRGGDPKTVAMHIQKLFQKKLGKPLKVRLED